MGSTALITADAGYHSEANLAALSKRHIDALIADPGMRRRDRWRQLYGHQVPCTAQRLQRLRVASEVPAQSTDHAEPTGRRGHETVANHA
jgi:hypothetical protein